MIEEHYCKFCGWVGVEIFEHGMRPCCPQCLGDVDETTTIQREQQRILYEKSMATNFDK